MFLFWFADGFLCCVILVALMDLLRAIETVCLQNAEIPRMRGSRLVFQEALPDKALQTVQSLNPSLQFIPAIRNQDLYGNTVIQSVEEGFFCLKEKTPGCYAFPFYLIVREVYAQQELLQMAKNHFPFFSLQSRHMAPYSSICQT